ncbi:hypothetical protein [Candidatus Cyanaurora vandensis]|uniref:hypothetical protein n=1 Tax=Candidatus Cyanaurora vandensis TaxID=2714958 RepID=UPI00257B3283|nr:hypothetical protein [Candidatus Cyanaurora vandensis]
MANLPEFLFKTFKNPDTAGYGRRVNYTPAANIADWLLAATGEVHLAELVYSSSLQAYFYRCEDPQDRAVQEEFGLVLQPSRARY